MHCRSFRSIVKWDVQLVAKHKEFGLDVLNEMMDREEYGEADCGA